MKYKNCCPNGGAARRDRKSDVSPTIKQNFHVSVCVWDAYLPAVSVCVDVERVVAAVCQNPQPAVGVKGHVHRAAGEGQPAVRDQFFFVLVDGEEVQRGDSVETNQTDVYL